MTERTITVKGIGSMKVAPDLVVITVKLTVLRPDYAETSKQAAVEVEKIRQAVVASGHSKKALKTTDFNIKAEYESVEERNGHWKQEFKGYSSTHRLKLEFDLDMKRLEETIQAISNSGTNPDTTINFSVKDKAAVQEELLVRAVTNAREKAAILTKESGVSLGDIKHIHYAWGEIKLASRTQFNEMRLLEARAVYSMDIQPEEIEADDSVTVIWEIR